MPQEIELKLEFAPDDVEALLSSHIVPADAINIDQTTVYFDTPDNDLVSLSFSLRVRHAAGKRIQTVKATDTGAAGLFARPEWERVIDSDIPVLDDTDPLWGIFREKLRRLQPVFEANVKRRRWTVESENSLIELVVDCGQLIAGDRQTPIREIELELKAGSPNDLFAMARTIDQIVPVRPGVLSKSDRGYRLLGPATRSVKATRIALDVGMTSAVAFQRIASACVKQYRLNEMLLADGNGDAVHQARVALRRLRSALSIYRPMLAGSGFEFLNAELRWLAGELGKLRDIDVLIERKSERTMQESLNAARREAHDDLAQALQSERTRALMIKACEWLCIGDWLSDPLRADLRNEPAADFAASALERYRKKVRRQGRNLSNLDDESRHRLRKDAKKLRYGAGFFAALFESKKWQKRRHARFIETLEAMQDKLGVLNDISSIASVLLRLGLNAEAGAERMLAQDQDKDHLIGAAADTYADFIDAKRFWR